MNRYMWIMIWSAISFGMQDISQGWSQQHSAYLDLASLPPPVSRKTNPSHQPWLLQTQLPLYLAGGGGLLLTSIGLIGSLAEEQASSNTPAPSTKPLLAPSPWGVLFFSGLSVMSSSVSAALWRAYPQPWLGVVGSVLAGSIAVAGSLFVALGQDTLMLSLGWGFLASLPVHIVLNVVGWFNIRHHQQFKALEEKSDKTSALSSFQVHVVPAILPGGTGIQIVGSF